ncbi:MAG: hypothetical protein L0H83_14715, partial [Salinisphaera sp.]|nr:hypothetical protein [Salinisphaera sp.]
GERDVEQLALALAEIARRSRGTPRVANSRLWWARNFATSEHEGSITLDIAQAVGNDAAAQALVLFKSMSPDQPTGSEPDAS